MIVSGAGSLTSDAGLWLRFLAALVDLFLILVALALLGVLLGVPLGAFHEADENGRATLTWALTAVSLFGQWLYFSFMESSTRKATLGKMVLGLQVVSANGETLSFRQATIRFIGKFASTLPLGAGYLITPFNTRKQALHDMLANAYVVKRQ